MTMKRKLRMAVDLAMTVMMPVLMAYSLAGELLHEWLGMAIFLLFCVHHALNWSWLKAIPKGRYPAARTINLLINLLLLLIMLLLPVSGIILSKHLFVAFKFGAIEATARIVHLLCSYWGFVLMSIHIGLHWEQMRGAMGRKKKAEELSPLRKLAPHLVATVIAAYGVFALIRRQIGVYLFLKTQFVFYDFSEPLLLVLLDYFAIMGLFACAGYYFLKLVKKVSSLYAAKRGGNAQRRIP